MFNADYAGTDREINVVEVLLCNNQGRRRHSL